MSLNLDLIYSDFNFTMGKSSHHKIYEFGRFRLETAVLMLYRDAEEIPLPPKAVATLLALIENRGEIVSKDELASLRRDAEIEVAAPSRWGTTFTLIQSWGKVERS